MKIIRKSIKYLCLFFVLISIFCVLLFLFLKHYKDGKLYDQIFEKTPPVITVKKGSIKGIGSEPQTLEIKISDTGAGLDGYTVRLTQKNRHIQLDNGKLNGEKEKIIKIPLGFNELKLTEGVASITIKAFDKSFWNNHKEVRFNVDVDARYPKLKVISTQHNLLLNGVQLVIYQAKDDNLKEHGVKVGNKVFQGFPLILLDDSIKDESVYCAFYSVLDSEKTSSGNKKITPLVVAKDNVGNTTTRKFYNKKIKRRVGEHTLKLTSYFVNTISKRLEKKQDESLNDFLIRVLKTQHKKESKEIFDIVHNVVFKRSLKLPFAIQKATILRNFGSRVHYVYSDKVVLEKKESGTTFLLTKDESTVNSISDGVVIFVKKMDYYGNVVGVAHGGNVVVLYAMAGSPLVKTGDKVSVGQALLNLGQSGISTVDREYLLEIRVNGYAVNPQEFFDNFWCSEHIVSKINMAKEDLGLITPEFDF
ncbi:MAG: murein hydrolase activator EnvC family protein [Bdellovibrionota bacterium]